MCDNCIGLVSVDPLEDLLIVCARRTELVCLLRTQYETCNAKSGGKQQGNSAPQLPLNFGSAFKMRPGSVPHLSVRPADNIVFADAAASVVSAASVRSPAARPTASGRQSLARSSSAGSAAAAVYNYGFEAGILSAEYSGSDPSSLTSGGGSSAGQVNLSIGCYPGLPHDLVSARRRQAADIIYAFLVCLYSRHHSVWG